MALSFCHEKCCLGDAAPNMQIYSWSQPDCLSCMRQLTPCHPECYEENVTVTISHPAQFVKLQRASTDTCLPANVCQLAKSILPQAEFGCYEAKIEENNIQIRLFPACGKMLLAFRVRKITQHGFFPDGENFSG